LAAGLTLGLGVAGCSPAEPSAAPTVRKLIAGPPFFIASRVGSRDWPEMTRFAFQQAAALPGLQAIDLGVSRTSDGVLVCSYDLTTARLTGQNLTIANERWATLAPLMVSAAETSNPAQPAQPLARLEDVLDEFSDRFVWFIEPRSNEAVSNLMARLIALGKPQRIVWKEPINSHRFAEARRHGFGTWGYVLNEPAHLGANLARFAASDDITMLGVSSTQSDKMVKSVTAAAAANGKPTIAWNIQNKIDVDRAVNLGCTGIAAASIRRMLKVPLPTTPLHPVGR
jgi:glycerophosphoryl diester phosphodiesterase